jgi:hypothetical protein
MPKFSLKDLLISSTYVAVGLGTYFCCVHYKTHYNAVREIIQAFFLVNGSTLVGIGLSYPFAKKRLWLRGVAVILALWIGQFVFTHVLRIPLLSTF